jgi:hypothetical protein
MGPSPSLTPGFLKTAVMIFFFVNKRLKLLIEDKKISMENFEK